MRTPLMLLQETSVLLSNVENNLRCFRGMFPENSPDSLMAEVIVNEVVGLSDLFARLICHYNSKN